MLLQLIWLGTEGANLFVAYIIRGHGIYVWGETLQQAWHYLEALEYLFELELTQQHFNYKPTYDTMSRLLIFQTMISLFRC